MKFAFVVVYFVLEVFVCASILQFWFRAPVVCLLEGSRPEVRGEANSCLFGCHNPEAQIMAKVFQTPTKSVLKAGKWSDRCPLREQTTPDKLTRKTPGRKTPGHSDRFIPNRRTMDFDVANFLVKENSVVNSPKNVSSGLRSPSVSLQFLLSSFSRSFPIFRMHGLIGLNAVA